MDIVFDHVRKLEVVRATARYVLVKPAGAGGGSRERDHWKGPLPDLMFPADRSWLVSTLWDYDWTCIGGPRTLVDAFLAYSDLRHRAREVDPSIKDATPQGHTAI